jgi:hypothetical protein
VLPNNTIGWKQGWFYLDNPALMLPARLGNTLVPFSEWTNRLTSRENEELRPLLEGLAWLKVEGLTGGMVEINFSRWQLQSIQDRVHLAYE